MTMYDMTRVNANGYFDSEDTADAHYEKKAAMNKQRTEDYKSGNYALAAARALIQNTDLSAEEIAKKSIKIASEICIFTNDNIICESVGGNV